MRRLVPLLILALLAFPASASAAVPKARVLATDAAATKALVAAARKVEACRSKWIDYTRCDVLPLSRGVLVETASYDTYMMSARSRPGRRFQLARGIDGGLAATCTPAGRGSCPRSGIWKPKPRPVMSPPFGHEWLPHETEFVARFEALLAAVERCRAGTGSLVGCAAAPEVQAARAHIAAWSGHAFELELGGPYYAHGHAHSSSEFAVTWLQDGSVLRECRKYFAHLVSPCVDGRW